MKRFYQILAALALVVSMQGCSQDSELDPESKIQLHLTGSINQTTRVNASGFEPNDPIGIYITKGDKLAEADAYEVKNEAFTYQDGDILAPGWKEVCWDINSTKLNVYAYYPYINNVESSDAVEFAVNSDQSTEEGFYDSDFLYANAEELEPQTTPVKLTFDHLLSRVNVYIDFLDGFTEEDVKNIESVKIKGLVTDGEIDLADGTVTAGDTKSAITMNLEDSRYPIRRSSSAIVFPQEGAMVVEVVVNDKVYSSTVNVDFESKYEYTYYFTIKSNPAALILGTTSINGWSDGGYTSVYDDMTAFGDKFNDFLQTAEQYVYDEESAKWVSSGEKIDANGDGIISEEEALAVKGIDIPKGVVDDLTGIERFVNLESLSCGQPENGIIDNANGSVPDIALTKLDVSKNTKLKRLIVNCNRLRELDVTALTDLEILCCYANQLTGIDVSKNTKLKKLDLGWNEMTSVDISKNTALEKFSLWDCPVTAVDLSNAPELQSFVLSYSDVTEIDFSANTKLYEIECRNNENLTSVDLSTLSALEYANFMVNNLSSITLPAGDKLEELWVYHNQLTTLDVSQYTNLTHLGCDANKLTTLNLCSNTNLKELYCDPMDDESGNNLLETLFISTEDQINNMVWFSVPSETTVYLGSTTSADEYNSIIPESEFDEDFLTVLKRDDVCYYWNASGEKVSYNIDSNGDGQISISEVKKVGSLALIGKNLSDLKGIEYFVNLTELDYTNNNIVNLDLSSNTKLKDLRGYGNPNTNINVTKNAELTILDLSGSTAITGIDLSGNPKLKYFECNECYTIKSLDFSNNPKLKRIGVNNDNGNDPKSRGALSSITFSNNTELTIVNVRNNSLKTINVSGLTNLQSLDCGDNALTTLDVSHNKQLTDLCCYGNSRYNGGATLQLSKLENNPLLERINCSVNKISAIDFSQNVNLKQVWCDQNQISLLDFSNSPNLEALGCWDNGEGGTLYLHPDVIETAKSGGENWQLAGFTPTVKSNN